MTVVTHSIVMPNDSQELHIITCILHKGTQVLTTAQCQNELGIILQITSRDIKEATTIGSGDLKPAVARALQG